MKNLYININYEKINKYTGIIVYNNKTLKLPSTSPTTQK